MTCNHNAQMQERKECKLYLFTYALTKQKKYVIQNQMELEEYEKVGTVKVTNPIRILQSLRTPNLLNFLKRTNRQINGVPGKFKVVEDIMFRFESIDDVLEDFTK